MIDNKIEAFLSESEIQSLLEALNFQHADKKFNKNTQAIAELLKGVVIPYTFNDSPISTQIVEYQSGESPRKPSDLLISLRDRIADKIKIKTEHSYLQILNMESAGSILPHYDASIPGYVNLKANIRLVGQKDDLFFYHDKVIVINPGDLYIFEASLYKHWSKQSISSRVTLSFGFMIPYKDLGYHGNEPRLRMSEKIMKKFK